jgi:hypothetical protein
MPSSASPSPTIERPCGALNEPSFRLVFSGEGLGGYFCSTVGLQNGQSEKTRDERTKSVRRLARAVRSSSRLGGAVTGSAGPGGPLRPRGLRCPYMSVRTPTEPAPRTGRFGLLIDSPGRGDENVTRLTISARACLFPPARQSAAAGKSRSRRFPRRLSRNSLRGMPIGLPVSPKPGMYGPPRHETVSTLKCPYAGKRPRKRPSQSPTKDVSRSPWIRTTFTLPHSFHRPTKLGLSSRPAKRTPRRKTSKVDTRLTRRGMTA